MKVIEAGTGAVIPALGYGTWRLSAEDAYEGVREALDQGYRHIDTAQLYGNEASCGRAVRDASVSRDEVFLTTKVWRDHVDRAGVLRTTDESLRRLGLDYVDLLLLHWPNAEVDLSESLDALTEVHQAGKARFIGVSNYPSAMLARAASLAPITTNQVEFHCLLGQGAVREEAARHGVVLTAYCPLAQGRLATHPVLAEIGAARGATAAQVALAWLLGIDGVAAIPKSRNRSRIAENLAAQALVLTPAERARIDALPKDRRTVDPVAFGIPWDPPGA